MTIIIILTAILFPAIMLLLWLMFSMLLEDRMATTSRIKSSEVEYKGSVFNRKKLHNMLGREAQRMRSEAEYLIDMSTHSAVYIDIDDVDAIANKSTELLHKADMLRTEADRIDHQRELMMKHKLQKFPEI